MSPKANNLSLLSLCCIIIIEGQHAFLMMPSHNKRPIYKRRSSSCLFSSNISRRSDKEERPTTTTPTTPRRVKIRAQTANSKLKKAGGGGVTLSSSRTKIRTSKLTAKSTDDKNEPTTSNNNTQQQQQKSQQQQPYTNYNKKYYKPTPHTKSGAPFQHQEMMDHTILTKEEEFMYGRQVVASKILKDAIEELLEEKKKKREEEEINAIMKMREEEEELMMMEKLDDNIMIEEDGEDNFDYDFLSYELEYLSVYGFRPSKEMLMSSALLNNSSMGKDNKTKKKDSSSVNNHHNNGNALGGLDLEDDLLINHAQHRSQHMAQLKISTADSNNSFTYSEETRRGPKRTGYRNSSSTSSAANRNSYTSYLHFDLNELTEEDVIHTLQLVGGKQELVNVLLDGAHAREVLMRRNVKLVMSIAKNWMRKSFSTANANNLSGAGASGGGASGRGNGGGKGKGKFASADKSTKVYLAQMYEGSWDRPSLDEAVQEGMLGLARAVDKYDPERGLRFSTYATHWITSYVRVCFQRAVTGCLRVPSQLHDIKAAYNKIVKDHLQLGSTVPEQGSIAKQLGVSEQRLRTAIRATSSLLSVDAPIGSSGSANFKGSMAGGGGSNSNELLLLDTLRCAEPKPEDQVEISFLRQCLENAMATELTPYERDVLRLRLGLDSGEGKTVREIAEISGGSVSMAEVRSAEREY